MYVHYNSYNIIQLRDLESELSPRRVKTRYGPSTNWQLTNYIYIYIYTYIHIHTHIYLFLSLSLYIYIYIYICIHTCKYSYM